MEFLHSYRFPYVVERVMGTLYRITHVRFVTEIPKTPDGDIVIEEKSPFRNGFLKDDVKTTLVKIIEAECRRAKKRMCVVFDVQECVYCEPDGSMKESKDPPSGGVDAYGTFDPPPKILKGLVACEKCGHFKGDCRYQGKPWKISCCCDVNICQKCNGPVYKYGIKTNIFDPANGGCWIIPISSAWGHRCPNGELGQLENSILIDFKTGEDMLGGKKSPAIERLQKLIRENLNKGKRRGQFGVE
jgi:hypothetical protein